MMIVSTFINSHHSREDKPFWFDFVEGGVVALSLWDYEYALNTMNDVIYRVS